MTKKKEVDKFILELKKGMNLKKCRKCGCMKNTLKAIKESLLELNKKDKESPGVFDDIVKKINGWEKLLTQIEYSCLGCAHCYPAAATNLFNSAFPQIKKPASSVCSFKVDEESWPAVAGEYFVLCSDCAKNPVAVSTLASVELADNVAALKPEGLCIVGKTETENIGIDKVVKNIITNPDIRFLILAGKDPKGHHSGKTLLALYDNGVDKNMRVIGSLGINPVLKNVTRNDINKFRKQVTVVDMLGCEDADKIIEKSEKLLKDVKLSSKKRVSYGHKKTTSKTAYKKKAIIAKAPRKVELDKAGYFVIFPDKKKRVITVEHYNYDNKLKNIIQGNDAKSIYSTIIQNSWVTELYHAAYLGKELEKAELSIILDFKYTQDGA